MRFREGRPRLTTLEEIDSIPSLALNTKNPENRQTNRPQPTNQANTKTPEFIDTENRLVVARGRGWEVGKTDDGGQMVQMFSYETKQPVMYSMAAIINNAVLHI